MEKVKAWLAAHSVTTHSIAVVFAALTTAYYEVPQFHDFVFSLYGHLPQGGKSLITVGIALYGWYRRGVTPQNGLTDGKSAS